MPPPEAKHVNVAPAAIPPQTASVAMDPAAMLGAHGSQASSAVAAVPSGALPAAASAHVQKTGVEAAANASMGDKGAQAHDVNGQSSHQVSSHAHDLAYPADTPSPSSLPQLELTVSPHRALADADRPLSRLHSKISSKNGRKVSTPRTSSGRPPRSSSGAVHRQDSATSDRNDSRKLLRRNTTG